MVTKQRISELYFITFYHPGQEHEPDSQDLMSWNEKEHRRKFLNQKGKYLNNSADKEGTKDELFFWGEWEPESTITKINTPIGNGPRYIHSPYYKKRKDYTFCQNTDPYVFGDHFIYTCCQQYQNNNPTDLKYMKKGSVVIFGSSFEGRFILDTVFVVGKSTNHNEDNFEDNLKYMVTKTYTEVAIKPLYQTNALCPGSKSKVGNICNAGDSFRLYLGINDQERQETNGMFSFVPCIGRTEGSNGILRPSLTLPEVISPKQTQGFRAKECNNIDQIKMLWNQVVAQVIEQGLKLGVYIEEPKEIIPTVND